MPDPATNRKTHWMVAAWPGMGNVAMLAAGYLIQKLGLKPAGNLPPRGRFDVSAVEVSDGVVTSPRVPRSLLYQSDATGDGPRLTVFVGEAQPNSGSYSFAQELMTKAAELAVDRVVTFASMASQLHPAAQPRVFGAATRQDMVDELRRIEVQPLKEGQIGGLNGVLLGAAAERGVPGVCLMGEIPFFAAGVPNPKAARAVLDSFGVLTGIEVDLNGLNPHIEAIERVLTQMLERMQSDEPGASFPPPGEGEGGGGEGGGLEAFGEVEDPSESDQPPPPKLDLPTRERIESLFAEARADRHRAVALKKELDRLHVFAQYEDRFLDLFKRAE